MVIILRSGLSATSLPNLIELETFTPDKPSSENEPTQTLACGVGALDLGRGRVGAGQDRVDGSRGFGAKAVGPRLAPEQRHEPERFAGVRKAGGLAQRRRRGAAGLVRQRLDGLLDRAPQIDPGAEPFLRPGGDVPRERGVLALVVGDLAHRVADL